MMINWRFYFIGTYSYLSGTKKLIALVHLSQVVDHDILEVNIWHGEEPWFHWSVQWITESLSIIIVFAKDGEVVFFAFLEWIDVAEESVWHTFLLTLWQEKTVWESEQFLAVGEWLVAFDGLDNLLVVSLE